MKLNYKCTLQLLYICLSIAFLLYSCTNEPIETNPLNNISLSEDELILHFYQNDNETKANFETGLKWCFSFLGAQLMAGSWQASTDWLNSTQLKIDFTKLGFNEQALKNFKLLIQLYKHTEEFKITGGIDGGRFVVSVLNNSNHYYKIIGMPKTLEEFKANYQFLNKKAAIIESAVALGERIIQMPRNDEQISKFGYLAEEISGSIIDSNQVVEEKEVMDIMPNGQLRFGIYNKNNELIGGAKAAVSNAGKPAKCLWCHEVNIQKGFSALTAIPGFYSPFQFDSIVQENMTLLVDYRHSLSIEIDFNDRSQHPELEKLYIRFMEPSAKRIAAEWNISRPEVLSKLSNLSTHRYDEFPELGDLYFRHEVQRFSPYKVLPSATTSRETTTNEPDLLP